MGIRSRFWLIIILIIVALFIDLPSFRLPFNSTIPQTSINVQHLIGFFPIKLGLDLQGGTQLVLETDMSKISADNKDQALESVKEVIERRVNLYGVSESVVQTSKVGSSRRIIVELPGIKDASSAGNLVGKTAQLQFREFKDNLSASESASFMTIENSQETGLSGSDLKKATVTFSNNNQAGPAVAIEFSSKGGEKFAKITKKNLNKRVGIFLDDQLIMDPTVQGEILGGNAQISGSLTPQTAKELEIQLNAGALPVPIKIIEQRSIGATLGQESIDKSIIAGIIGLVAVMIYMLFYYGWLGLVADLALIVYSLFVLAIFKTGLFILPPVTLNLAGIAGFILSIGMAVDANILIFERMKEEIRWGKSPTQSIDAGFRRAWSSIRDSNVSSLITALILYTIGTGPVKGFALTLAIGVLVSMFTAITVTRTILKMFIK